MAVRIDWLFTHEITVEPYIGQSGHGPIYGPPAVVWCFLEHKRRRTRDRDGREVTTSTTAYCALGEQTPPGSRVTVDGRTSTIVKTERHSGGGLPTPDHQELTIE